MKRRDFLKNTLTAAAALCGSTAVAAMNWQLIESNADNIGTRTDNLDILRRFNDTLTSLGNTLQQHKCGHLVPNDILWDGDRCWIVENLIYIPNYLAFPDKVSYDPDLGLVRK